MKKAFLALAALSAAGTALAQSSVTLYGVADAGIARINPAFHAQDASPAPSSGRFQFASASKMNNADSRLGVRGTEDLGGGLKAGFQFETGLDLDNGAATTPGAFWARQANFWLAGGWGTLKLGRAVTPSNNATSAWEITRLANYSAVANTYNYAGAGSRSNSQISYATPNLSGFAAELAYVIKHDNLVGGVARDKWDLALTYKNGPIGAGLAVNKLKDRKAGYTLGGRYNFGNFALAASYNQAHNNANRRRAGFSLGGSAQFGAFSAALDLTRDSKNEWNAAGKRHTNAVLEGKYSLSKRTFLYAAFLRYDGTNNVGLGVRHNF